MKNLREFVRATVRDVLNEQRTLNETIQLADKIYFKTGKLSNDDRDLILRITNGNNYTKIISDFYFFLDNNRILYRSNIMEEIELLYYDLVNYDKNVFPISEYDIFNPKDIGSFISSLENRRKILKNLKSLPSIALRNLKKDVRKERNSRELGEYAHLFDYFMAQFSLLSNKPPELQSIIFKKMFKNNTTLEDWSNFADDKENLIAGITVTKDDIKKLSTSEDLEVIYEQGDAMIIRVDSRYGIKAIGCNSLWCFTYGENAYRHWDECSYNDMVYVLIDFKKKTDSPDFMYVLTKPLIDENNKLIKYKEDDDKIPFHNMINQNYDNPYLVLQTMFGSKYKTIIKKYLNFEY